MWPKFRALPADCGRWVSAHRDLSFLLVIALILRGLCLLWGTPLGGDCGPARGTHLRSYHYDEDKVYRTTAAFPAGYVRSDLPYPTYGTTLQHTLGLLLLPVKVVMLNDPVWRDYFTIVVWIASRC